MVCVPLSVWDWRRDQWGWSLHEAHAFSQAPEEPTTLETLQVVQRGEHSLRLQWQLVPGARGFFLRWRSEGEKCPPCGVRDH